MKKILSLIFLILTINIFAEIPHSYVSENPTKEVTVTDTIKKHKEKAELNISVTKLSSQETEGILNLESKKIYFNLDLEKFNILKTDKITIYKNEIKVSGNTLDSVLKDENYLEISYDNVPDVIYITISNSTDEIKKVIKGNLKVINAKTRSVQKVEVRLREETFTYDKTFLEHAWQVESGSYITPDWCKTIKATFSCTSQPYGSHKGNNGTHYGKTWIDIYEKDGVTLIETKEFTWWTYLGGDSRVTVSEKTYFEKTYDRPVKAKLRWNLDLGGYKAHIWGEQYYLSVLEHIKMTFTHDVIKTLEGRSTIKANEYYPKNEFIKFNSTTLEEYGNLKLENSLRDVIFTTEGQGFAHLQAGDRFVIDGKILTIGAGGNLSEQAGTIGDLKYTYKVESGKLRIALNDWGILEPNRTISIEAWRTEDGEERKLTDHQLTIIAPRKISGVSEVKFSEDYKIRDTVRFQAVSLTAPGIMNLETPIPAGVSLKAIEGYGIPFLKEGDILEIGNNMTRSSKQYVIGSGDNLKKTTVDLPGTTLSLHVENGKVRLGLNSWLVNENANISMRAIRGTNEISRNTIALEVPEAPFDVVKNGILDFGTILAGSKNKYAETDIVLEMLQDVTEVKYSLSTSEPELENPNGKKLKAKEIKAVVLKQGDRRYLLKVQGYLDVPKEQELGEYRGSMILNVNIK